MSLDYHIRFAKNSDDPFVLTAWSASLYGSSHLRYWMSKSQYKRRASELIDDVYRHSCCLVACDPEDPDHDLGFIVYGPHAIHYVFVKEPYRRCGVAKALVKEAYGPDRKVFAYTFWTYVAEDLRRKYNLRYMPKLLREHTRKRTLTNGSKRDRDARV